MNATPKKTIYQEAIEFEEFWLSLSPTDRTCYYIRVRWLVWRPAWLSWVDPILKFVLFPPKVL